MSENGWGALMGWAAGEENLGRHPSSDVGRTVTGYTEHAGERTPFAEPFMSGPPRRGGRVPVHANGRHDLAGRFRIRRPQLLV
ncbi:DUF5956 family protein [Arthrobacter sp. ISL-65]|uniref:DUF5956 family protein n=1 Tax=Arthrobacter sp. ISL-65 TaxID=2819112 RepID=UPI0035A8DE15